MRAAGLHAIATILESEAVLISSSTPKHPELLPLAERVTSRIAGVIASRRYVLCQYNILREHIKKAMDITPGRRAPTVSPLEDESWVAVSAMIEVGKAANTMDALVAIGAEDVFLIQLDNCRV